LSEGSYPSTVRELSNRIVAAQKGIRILDAVKWNAGIREAFFAAGGREQPRVDVDYYRDHSPLGFDPSAARETFAGIENDVASRLGRFNPAGQLMTRMCREYRLVIDMLEARGTPAFSRLSRELYGSASDAFHAGGPTSADLALSLDGALRSIHQSSFLEAAARDIPTERAVVLLQERLDRVFCESDARVRVCVSDGIVADAAAGSDYIKLRADTFFSEHDLRVLEAHEGWVHVGTTLNGRAQPWCTFLGKGTPSTTITQEGLALFVEIVSFASHPARLRRVIDRIRCIHLAEQGASFRELYGLLLDEDRSPDEAWATCVRVFRGSGPEAGPFTKDLAYGRGFVLLYNFIRIAVRRGRLDRIPLLFCGKVTLEDVGSLAELLEQGIVVPARHLPPPLADLNALTAWMAYSNFLNRLDLDQVEADFARLLA